MKPGEINVIVSPQEKYYDNIIGIAKSFSDEEGIACFVTVNRLYSALLKDFSEAGISGKNFLFVDAVTKSINPGAEAQKNCIFLDSPSDLTRLSITISEILSSEKVTGIIFDSISTLLVYNKDGPVFKFIHALANKIKQYNKSAVLLVGKGESTDKIMDELSIYADRVSKNESARLISEEEVKKSELELVYLISHEMRTPLTSIISLIPLIAGEKIGKINEKQKEALGLIYYDARRMGILIDNIINMSEIDKGLIISSIQEFRIKEMVQDILTSLNFMAKKKRQSFKVEIKNDLSAKADKNRIRQAISNVITNSFKYGREGGNISISGKNDNANILISVKDDGPGINKEEMQKIFSKPDFTSQKYASEGNRNKPLSGIGYGLYVSRKIIEAHGGKMWAESGQGKGAEFFMLFPAKQNA